jgi:hypothetical protein
MNAIIREMRNSVWDVPLIDDTYGLKSGRARSRHNALLTIILVADTISGVIMSLIVYERTVRLL